MYLVTLLYWSEFRKCETQWEEMSLVQRRLRPRELNSCPHAASHQLFPHTHIHTNYHSTVEKKAALALIITIIVEYYTLHRTPLCQLRENMLARVIRKSFLLPFPPLHAPSSPPTLSFSFEMLKYLVNSQSGTQIHTFCAMCITAKQEFAANNWSTFLFSFVLFVFIPGDCKAPHYAFYPLGHKGCFLPWN